MMNKLVPDFIKFIIITTLLILTGCTSNVYNTPYIDTAETVKLKNNLSTNEVIKSLGKPLYVEYGTQKTGEISWVYEVRTREVESKVLATSEIIPNKDNDEKRPGQPIHYLRIIFADGKVSKWEAFDKKEVAVEQKNIAKKFFFHPKVGFDIISYEYKDCPTHYESCYYPITKETSDNSLVLGAYLGWEKPSYRFGLDARLIGNTGVLATIEKRNLFSQFNLIAGAGIYGHYQKKEDNPDIYDYDAEDGGTVLTVAKIGVSKEMMISGQPISIGIDLLVNEFGIYPGISIGYIYK